MRVEQINNTTGTVTYLHHDQQGSTRLLTGSTGKTEATFTYDAYGNQTGHTGTATTPLGFDGQYTSADTGLIYLRARVYDPATAQFLTVDPEVGTTRAPYNYAGDNPVNRGDATGLSSWNPFSESFWTEGNFISESPLNPIPYYEQEVESYENGCGYLASVTHGLEGTLAGATLVAGGEDAEGADLVADGAPSLLSRVKGFLGDEGGEFDPFANLRVPTEETTAYAGDAAEAQSQASREVAKLNIASGTNPNSPAVPSGGVSKLALILSLLSRIPH
jgi:RHS repeat-associated protein